MKRFIATHTFHSEEARAGYYKAISEMPDGTYLTTPNAICLQVFNSDSDFFSVTGLPDRSKISKQPLMMLEWISFLLPWQRKLKVSSITRMSQPENT